MTARNAWMLLTITLVGSRSVTAQDTGFALGQIHVGAVGGYGDIHSALSYGVRLEKGMASLEDLGDALLGVQIVADRYSYVVAAAGHKYQFTQTNFSAVANYHMFVEDRRWDPFIGLGLGHQNLSQRARDFGQPIPQAASSGVVFVFRAGFRYFFKPRVAAYVDAGTGGASINAGATFRLK